MDKPEIYIESKGKTYKPAVLEGVRWETFRSQPARLIFKVYNDNYSGGAGIDFSEGDRVLFKYGDLDVFSGFVFTKSRGADQIITVTAYDRLRYFLNKDSYFYTGKTASAFIRMLAADFSLPLGEIEETWASVSRVEDNVTLLDMVLNALDATKAITGEEYAFYDNLGDLTLKNVKRMKLDTLMCDKSAGDFLYTSSIDKDTYNKVKIMYSSQRTGKEIVSVTGDAENQRKWGVLQYFKKVRDMGDYSGLAEEILSGHNRVSRSLEVKNVLGSIKARAGCLVPVSLILGDINAEGYFRIDEAKHIFSENSHLMDLRLRGGFFE
ncbi:MAG: hydrolase [Firmicutes bacterium]|nr:hydrolase [Bacillota bacterium]